MEDYKPNSKRFKDERQTVEKKKVEKVVSGKTTVKKKGGLHKLTDSFISDEASNVGTYILTELVIPTVKQTIVDAIRNSAEMIFLGKTSSRDRRPGTSSPYISYDRYSSRRDSSEYRRDSRESVYDLEKITFDRKSDADNVLAQMDEIMADYGLVSVADFYDLAGISSPYTANKYGWTNLRNAEVVHVRDGYIIRLPRAVPTN